MGTLSRKLIASQMIAGLLAGGVLSLLLQRQIWRVVTQDFLDQGRISARAVAGDLAPKLAAQDKEGLQTALERGISAEEADWGYVKDPSGAIVAQTFQGTVPDSVLLSQPSGFAGVERASLPGQSAAFYVVREPIEGGSAGTVYLGFREVRLQATLRRAEYVMLATVLLVVALGVAALSLIARRHLAPVQALTEGARIFAKSGATAWEPIPVSGRDEVGLLTEAFNQMAEKVREQQRLLESRVQERTEELTRLNRRLEMDIQLRQRTQEALENNERMLRTLTAASPVGIFQANGEGRCHYVNERLERLVGRKAAELNEDGWRKAVHPEDLPAALEEWKRAARAHHDFEQSLRIVTPQGEVRRVFVRAAALRTPNGAISGFVGTVEKVTDAKPAESLMKMEYTS